MKTNRLARTIAVVGLATAGLVGTAGMASASQSVAPPSHKVVSAQLTSTAKYPTTVFLDPGMTGSVAGQEVSGTDVYVKVDYLRDGKSVDMWGKNSEIWRPSIGFGDGSNWDRYSVDQSRDKSEGGKDFAVTRNSDGNWTKEFTINVK